MTEDGLQAACTVSEKRLLSLGSEIHVTLLLIGMRKKQKGEQRNAVEFKMK